MNTKQLLNKILHYTKPHSLQIFGAIFCALVSVTMALVQPVLIGRAVDAIIGKGNVQFDAIVKNILLIGIVLALGALFQWLVSVCTYALAFRSAQSMRKDIFAHINHLPLHYIDNHACGDLTARISSDIDKISDGLLHVFTQLFTGVITIVGTIIFMLIINPWLSIVVIILTPLSLFVAAFIAKRSHAKFAEQAKLRGEVSAYSEEIFGGSRLIQAFDYGEESQKNFEKINNKLYGCGLKAQFYSAMVNPATRFVNNIVYASVGVVGAILTLVGGTMTAGSLTTFLMYANHYTKPFNEISGVVNELQSALAAARRVFAVLDEPLESDDSQNTELLLCDGTVNLSNVYFSYSKEKPLIKNLNIDVFSGEKVAIVGPTGCGKTTLINLLMRFYDIGSGNIYVNKQPIKSLTRASLRHCYGMVLQDTWLFSGTIAENISYSKPNATKDEIIEASKLAHCHHFISTFPNGYETVLSENGDNLSQGQKQLLCIARIMLIRPPMLILDEATSNIDTRTELKIQEAFATMSAGKTSFVVAHRLSTIKESDIILVMNKGDIVEQGSHAELIAKKGFYYTLYNSQFNQ